MPYIDPSRRMVARIKPENVGELCYALTVLCQEYTDRRVEKFALYGDVRHALDTTWDVHFLPKLLTYEVKKREENGDV